MKNLLYALTIICPMLLPAQTTEVKSVLEKTLDTMQEHALNAKNVDWEKLRAEAFVRSQEISTPLELGEVMRFLFKSLDDSHGRFMYDDSTFHWQKEKVTVNEIYKSAFANRENQITTRSIQNLGYLRMPSVPQGSSKKRAQSLNDGLCKLLDEHPMGLIIDLRLNRGGSMWPMILGVGSILEKGAVGNFSYPSGKIKGWILDEGNIYDGTDKRCSVIRSCGANLNIPVVVITGPFTASAAEDLIVALKTRSNTTFIGEATAGAVTVNNGYRIDAHAGLNLAVAALMDKNHVVYKDKIQPDILVEGGDNFKDIAKDEKIKRAIAYFDTLKN